MSRWEQHRFAVGHLAIGYITSKASSKLLKIEIDIPMIFTLSVIPDIDLLIPHLQHRGPTHSIIVALVIFIPIFILYKRKAIPYFIALIGHALIGDYMSGSGTQLLWPITTQNFGADMNIASPANIAAEWTLFIVLTIMILETRDIAKLFKPHRSNLILLIPTFTVLLPTFLSFPLEVPFLLIPPHVAYIAMFIISVVVDLVQR